MNAPETWDRLAREIALAERLKLRATPSFIIDGKLYSGARSAADLLALVEEARP